MTTEEALIQMTIRWLEAEAKLKNSVPKEAVLKLREEVLSRAPASLTETFHGLFEEAGWTS